MIRATGILTALTFAAVAGAQQPAKPAAMKHDTTKAKAAAPAAKPAAAPEAKSAMKPEAKPMAKPEAAKKDTTKKPATKKPGV